MRRYLRKEKEKKKGGESIDTVCMYVCTCILNSIVFCLFCFVRVLLYLVNLI